MDDFKLKQMNASAAMFRRTLGGTPAGSGDDMYNDRIDNINIGEQNLVEIGKDEAGNPIMGNPLNAIVENAPPTKAETQGPLANAADFLNKVGESMFLDENGKTKSATDIAGSVFNSTALGSAATQTAEAGNYLYNFATATPEQQRAMALPNLAKAGLKEQIHKLPNATELEHSQLYENFYYGANSAQHNAEVKRIADTIGVREEVFANDPELYKNASLMAERIERMKKSKKYQDKDGNINMQKIYDDIPGLSKVQKEKGTAAAALVLANLEGMQTIGNVYKNNTAGQFFGSVGAGLSKEIGSIRKIWNWMGPTYGARLPNAEERTALAEVDANMRAIPKYSYNTTAQTIGAMLGGFLENAHYMGSSIIPRAAIALATRGKGGTITQKAGDVLSVATMAAITAPLQYEELINSVDENGNQKYTPQQARAIAIAQAIPQAILEDYSLRQIGGAIFGKSAAPALRDIIKKSAGLEAMKAGVADYIKFKVRDAVKAGTISYGSEFAEEFEQGISDRVVENLAQIFINGEDADVQSIESILYGAAGDTIEAWNAIAGFGVAGLLLNPIANTRAVLNFRNHVRMATTDKMVQGMTANAHYGSVLSGVWENKKQIKELHDKAPDVEQTILDAHNKEAGIEYGFVNIKELRKTENGEKIVQDIAQRNNVSDEELAACLDGSGMLRVKTSTLMQMEVNETQQNSIKENVTTELGTFTPAQQKAFFEVLESQMKGMKDFSDKTYKEAVDNIIKARFPDEDQAKLAREIIEANYDNPLAEFRRRLNSINTELWEEVEAYVPQLREALKENGIKLNKGETFKDIAVKIASGQADERFDIPALASTLGEIRTGLAPSAEKLTQLVDAREKLLALRDRFIQLKPGEIVATATLSAEGLKVYDALNSMMGASQNENVRAAARANALMMARMADNMAKAYRAARNVDNYTAEDYMREFFRLDVNAQYNEMPEAAQLFQVSPAEFERQKAEVRKQYENTDQWMKAPNGEDTNLTEDQWVTVRTDAFKNWFGDWEEGYESSQVLDENGEPLVVKHWTMEDVDFDTFSREFLGDNTIDNASEPAVGATSLLGFWFNSGGDENLSSVYDRDMDLFLSIENPKEYASLAELAYFINIEDSADLTMEDYQRAAAELKEALQDEGYDGIVINDEEFGGKSFVAFEPNQIKDATGRNVGFDPNSGNIYLQEAYHGTGARFNRFNTDYINTGEGMQYYGWGLYFSKNREVAEEYRRRFTPSEVVVSYAGKLPKSKQKVADALAREIQTEVIRGASLEEALQKRLDYHTQSLKFYEENPKQATKKKLKDTQDKIDFLNANKDGFKSETQGEVFKVDIPEDNVLLDRDKSFEEQPDEVKNALQNIWAELSISKPLEGLSGQDIYIYLSRALNGDKNASLKLNDNGVKGIKYTGLRDGQSFVVFDDNAINVLEKYYQQGRTAKGAISVNERNERLIQLFTEGADQSTFIHEMGHMFLMDLQTIAGIDPNSKQAKDLKTILDWAEYKPGQSEDYKGTASYEEFRRREEAIKQAEAKGDTAEAQRLKDVWVQERFARAFEEYLRTGEAPARGLKKAFRDFKKWLTEIYNDVTGAGVRATPEVEAIMARIVASEEEIETLEAANNIARKIADSNVMPENATELIKQWQEEAKEEAKEKLLKELVKQYYQKNLKNINEKLDEIRKNTRAELQQVPCFICEQLIKNGTSMEGALEITGFANEQEYKDALEKAGGSLNNAVNAVVKAARENMIKQMPSNDELYNMAEDAINSGDYNARLSMLEADILKELKDEYNSLPAKLRRAFEEIDKHFGEEMSKETWAAFKRSIFRLKYAERWGAQEYILIKEFEDAVNKLEEPDRAAVEKLRQRYEKLKEQTIRNKQWINGIAGATDGKMKAIKKMAAERLGRESVSVATNARYWHRQALSAAKRAWDGLRKVNKGEQIDYDNAVAAKEEQAVYDAMTAQAIKNKQQLNRWMNGMNGFLARAKRMADPKFKADPNMRYYYSHLMYVFGIRNSDGIPPTDLKPITEVLADLRASHQFEDEVPEWLINAANATEQGKDYQQLTMGQLQELKKFTDILYTLARNQNQLLTMDVSMDDVVADCTVDYLNNVDYKVGHQKIGEVRGAIGDYMNGLLKPEVILSLLGGEKGSFIKYIYRILFDAAEAEEKAREAEAVAIRALYKAFYSKEELRAMLNDTVMTTDENGKQVPLTIGDDSNITKENLICMALNMGNSTNRARLCVGLFGVTNEQQLAMAEAEVTRILQENLTENDWKFVQAMWNHIDSFADPVSKVLEKSLGVPLDRVKREPFTVVFPDGRTMRMEGGYYPIVKDGSKSTRQTEFDQLEEAKAVGGVSVFGTGMSATKERADNLFVDNGPLKLTLDVAHNHITAQIHLIHARMAVRDVYKVINNKAIQGMIRQTCGEGTVQSLNEWVLSCWAPPVRTRSWYENVVAKVRSKTVGAIMAYRASTALLNAANVVYMAQEIGVKNALIAMAEFYKHPSRNKQMILDVSVFMRNRASNIDRDLNAQQDSVLNRHEGVLGKLGNAIDKATGGRSEDMRYMIDKYANWMIETTDMMVSLPLYKWQFEQTYSEEIAKGVPEEEARETANFEATRRVQKVFGSSREVDRSKVQREKNEMVKMLTPFFTFANTMFNAVWSKYYAGKFSGSERVPKVDATGKPVLDADGNQEYTTVKKNLRQRYARFVRAAFFNFVLGALVETWLRQIPNWLAGTGDDDDDEDRIGVGVLSVNKKQWGKNVIDSAAAGFPLVNIATENIVSALEGRRSGGRGVGVIAGSIGRWTTVANDIVKIAQGKDSVDAIDFMRDVVRVTNIRTGMSDTITDAVFNTVRFIGDDYQLDNMADLREYIAKTIFDRKLKKK